VALNLKNLRIKTQALLSTRENTNISEGFEEITEAMAERLTDQIPELIKGIDSLQENTGASQYHKIELQKWIDNKNAELLNLKETVNERKYSYLGTLSDDARVRLAECHPVWMINFNLHLEQIQDLIAIHKGEIIIVQCFMGTDILRYLKIFYYATDGNVLTINSNINSKHVGHELSVKHRVNVRQNNITDRHTGEYFFQSLPEGHAQWTFTGNRWGFDSNILWLDFGKRNDAKLTVSNLTDNVTTSIDTYNHFQMCALPEL
jgi:hypothetical protein